MMDLYFMFCILVGVPSAVFIISKYEEEHEMQCSFVSIVVATVVVIVAAVPVSVVGTLVNSLRRKK